MTSSRQIVIALAASLLAFIAGPFATAQPASTQALPARNSDAAGVRVVVKPKDVAGASVWEFEVVMDTHTKPLNDDLTKTAVLVDASQRRYAPIAWQGDPPGGHHRKGVLRFPAPAGQPKSFAVHIEGLGGAAKRTFQWKAE